jgi:basic membrane protein A and related proteins
MSRNRTIAAVALASLMALGATGAALAQDAPGKLVLIGNQRFGDQGPMDAFAAALDRCASEFGFEVSKLESIDAAGFEDDIRAIASEGADLIYTTFPPMTPAQVTVAKEFPEQKFRAIYQFINLPDAAAEDILANVESTEYQGGTVGYVLGVVAAHLSKSGILGMVSGTDDPGVNAVDNGFAQGALSVNPDISVEFGVAGSYDDPAKGKEIALAMASRGVDVIGAQAAKTHLGVIEGAKESGILTIGEVTDNSALYPEGYVGYFGLDFGTDVYLACKEIAEGTWTGGTHNVLDIATNTYFVPWDVIDAWAATQTFTDADTAAAAIEAGKAAEAGIKDGSIVVENNTTFPENIGG